MKMIKLAIGIIGLMMSASLFAAAVDEYTDKTGDLITGTVDNTSCPLLTSQAKIKLSTGVKAAMHCRTIWGDAIIAACHASGNVNPTTETCVCTNTGTAATPVYSKNISICPGACDTVVNGGGYLPVDTEAGADTVLVAGRKAFGASTEGGSVSSYSLGDTGLCDATNIKTITLFP